MRSAKQSGSLILIALVAACANLAAEGKCSTQQSAKDTVIVSEKDNDKKISIARGSTLVVKLEARPGTGYAWRVVKNEGDRLRPEGKPTEESPDKEQMDGIEYQVFRFKAVSQGAVALELHYARAWEKETPPEKVFRIEVQIR